MKKIILTIALALAATASFAAMTPEQEFEIEQQKIAIMQQQVDLQKQQVEMQQAEVDRQNSWQHRLARAFQQNVPASVGSTDVDWSKFANQNQRRTTNCTRTFNGMNCNSY
jgi:N-acetylglucosamine-6-phosphate deacetylase